MLLKLSFLLKEKARLEAVSQAGEHAAAGCGRGCSGRGSVQLPISVASGGCRLGKQRDA